MMINKKGVALYVHIPFCRHICSYCDFCHRIYNRNLALKWLEEFKLEFKKRVNDDIHTIYLGGGTPTSLDDDIFEEVLKEISKIQGKEVEYTIEINPETFTITKAKMLRKYHINRASIGLESSDINELKILGRHHTYDDVINTVKILKEYTSIDNYSLDIIYSFPSQTIQSFKKTIEDAIKLKPKHLSLYSLTVEENTVFGKKGIKSFDDDIEADYYELAKLLFKKYGYIQYEVSNFCIENYESKHNLAYWLYDDFIGISIGASSKYNHQRIDNTKDFSNYMNHEYYEEIIDLSTEDEMFEYIMMSLRLTSGINISDFENKFDIKLLKKYEEAINKNIKLNNIVIVDGFMKCTNLALLNTILIDFLE